MLQGRNRMGVTEEPLPVPTHHQTADLDARLLGLASWYHICHHTHGHAASPLVEAHAQRALHEGDVHLVLMGQRTKVDLGAHALRVLRDNLLRKAVRGPVEATRAALSAHGHSTWRPVRRLRLAAAANLAGVRRVASREGGRR
eukprot:CAMPEP_0205919886 /NCGR_PEP_ID=MMETSP1325-20131115/10725_1 /ASSEMBLY_ACC=CAM_ASM_000708 /TAXON_ID=236786 /ORGANISM="Florenciella sp., Strain RCC1007" /LENGTH=142 /DNA_ID=CAMNT_0053287525 /DNA_START=213 /DNA_END=637 /DNA_ORIENTATION=-